MKKRTSGSVYPGLRARQTTSDMAQVSLVLSYDDRKKFADFFNILLVVDRRVQASKKEIKKKKIVHLKARDPTRIPAIAYSGLPIPQAVAGQCSECVRGRFLYKAALKIILQKTIDCSATKLSYLLCYCC